MLIRFFKWFRGYLHVRIEGYSPERFINLCRNKNILIWNLSKTKDGYDFYMTVDGYRQIRPIARKTHTRPKIIHRYGFVFKEHRMKKHRGFVTGILLFLAIVYILSLYIWDVNLEGNYSYTEDVIFGYLSEIGVKPGVMKSRLNCQKIEEAIRKKYTDIGWISAEIKGTKLNLKIVETNMPVPFESATTPCHIIASHNGTIVSIITRQGTPVVEKGAKVKKGDILVSGVLEITDDGGEVVKKEPVVSDSDVYLETQYSYKKSIPVQYKKHKKTGRIIKKYGIRILDRRLNLYNPLKKFHSGKKYDIIATEKNMKLTHSFVLPISFQKKIYEEYIEQNTAYSKKELVKKQNEYFFLYIKKLKEEGVVIKSHNVKIQMGKDYCVSQGTLTVWEPQHETKEINETEWRITKTDEHSGNDT